MACLALIESLRPASCCSVEVVNGARGLRVPGLDSRFETDAVPAAWIASARVRAAASSRTSTAFFSSPWSSKSVPRASGAPSTRARRVANESVALRAASALDVPVRRGDEGHALALALDDHAGGGGLDAAGRRALLHLEPQHGADVPAVEAVEDAARLLRVDQCEVEFAGVVDRLADRILGDLVEDHALHGHLGLERLEQVPRDGLALAVLICGEQELVGVLESALQFGDGLAAALALDVIGVEAVLDVDGVLAVRLLLVGGDVLLVRQIADVPDRAEHLVAVSEVALDRLHLRR